MNITRIPTEYAEYFQILRYEKGQFYRSHHDQQTAHWTPQGVRVYTFFVYLSDVEEGGGTKFNNLDIVVTPKLGRAVLWPSVREDDLRTGAFVVLALSLAPARARPPLASGGRNSSAIITPLA